MELKFIVKIKYNISITKIKLFFLNNFVLVQRKLASNLIKLVIDMEIIKEFYMYLTYTYI